MKPRVYLETTVISYLAARPSRDLVVAAHQQVTREWWDGRKEQFELFVSPLVIREVSAGDQEAARQRLALVARLPQLALNEEVRNLAGALLNRGAVPRGAEEDAFHIAIAAAHGMDYLLTWNCRHIANAEVEQLISGVCAAAGLECPVICTPEELMGG